MEPKPVLIVDDDEAIRTALKISVEMFGYKAFCAANGQEALDLLGTMPRPKVILLDLMMPVMDGRSFAEALGQRPQWADVPIVVLTAFVGKADVVPNARRVLNKPFELSALLDSLQRFCA
jgi:CheY-like chemotaxis protein